MHMIKRAQAVGFNLAELKELAALKAQRVFPLLYPTMTVLLSALVYKRAIGREIIAAMVLCYVGILRASLVFVSTLSCSVWWERDMPSRASERRASLPIRALHRHGDFSTVLPAFLLSHAIRCIGSVSTSLIGTIGPASRIYMAHVFLNRNISPLQIAGASLHCTPTTMSYS